MIWSAVLFGFFSVFGWNSGQKVWDKYIEPKFETQAEQTVNHQKDPKEKDAKDKE